MRGDYWPGYDDKSNVVSYTEPDMVGGSLRPDSPSRTITGPVPSKRQAAAMGVLIREKLAEREVMKEREAAERKLQQDMARISLGRDTLAL